MKWFKHDSNASTDAKLEKLLIRYGMEGYGLYWYCLELIASQVEKHNLTFELEHDAEVIAHRSGIHIDSVQEMMAHMVDAGLFEDDRGVVTCLKMAKRTDEYTQKLLKDSKTPDKLPTISGQSPEKSALIEDKKLEENRTEDKTSVSGKPDYGEQIDMVISHLNKRADRQYRRGQANDRLIKGRLKEGHTVADLCSVVDHKCHDWLNDRKWNQYLRPSTLFNAEKFAQYFGAIGSSTPQSRSDEEFAKWIGSGPKQIPGYNLKEL